MTVRHGFFFCGGGEVLGAGPQDFDKEVVELIRVKHRLHRMESLSDESFEPLTAGTANPDPMQAVTYLVKDVGVLAEQKRWSMGRKFQWQSCLSMSVVVVCRAAAMDGPGWLASI